MLIAPDIDPVAINIGPLKIHWYGLMYLVGFVGGWAVGVYRAKQPLSGWQRNEVADPDARYTKFIIVDEVNLKHRSYPAARGRQAILLNRDIIRLFSDVRVSDSFLLQNNLREILFRKPA